MLWNDLRDFLNKLEELGELKRVTGASWEEDIGGITELMTERRGPALLFDEIEGYPKGYRVASNLFRLYRELRSGSWTPECGRRTARTRIRSRAGNTTPLTISLSTPADRTIGSKNSLPSVSTVPNSGNKYKKNGTTFLNRGQKGDHR